MEDLDGMKEVYPIDDEWTQWKTLNSFIISKLPSAIIKSRNHWNTFLEQTRLPYMDAIHIWIPSSLNTKEPAILVLCYNSGSVDLWMQYLEKCCWEKNELAVTPLIQMNNILSCDWQSIINSLGNDKFELWISTKHKYWKFPKCHAQYIGHQMKPGQPAKVILPPPGIGVPAHISFAL